MKKTMKIEGMDCVHCQAKVQKALSGVAGVSSVSVDLKKGTAAISAADSVTDDALSIAVTDAGYDVVSIQ